MCMCVCSASAHVGESQCLPATNCNFTASVSLAFYLYTFSVSMFDNFTVPVGRNNFVFCAPSGLEVS